MNRRSPYLESFAIFTKLKTSMQAAPTPRLTPAKAASAAPWPAGTSARPWAGAAAAAAGGGPGEPAPGRGGCYPPPAASCVCIPSRTADGRPCGKTQLRGRRAGCEGRGERAGRCAPRGAPAGEPPGVWGGPRRGRRARRPAPGARTEPAACRPAWRTRAPLPALQLPPCLLPRAPALLLSPPPPAEGVEGCCSPVTRCVCFQI